MAGMRTQGEFRTLPNVGHYLQEEAPDQIIEWMLAFLNRGQL